MPYTFRRARRQKSGTGIPLPFGSTSPLPLSKSIMPHRRIIAISIVVVLVILYIFIPPSRRKGRHQLDNIPFNPEETNDYFADFEGQECGIRSASIYLPSKSYNPPLPYCSSRASLLAALSNGGRHGFDSPFYPQKCHYRWYNTAETCMILDRFDGVVFVGDDMMASIYAAFNMLVREDLALGGLKGWELDQEMRSKCRCDEQVLNGECIGRMVGQNDDLAGREEVSWSGYTCNITPHFYLRITDSPAPAEPRSKLSSLLAKSPDGYKPIPIIHSLGLSVSLSYTVASSSMDEWIAISNEGSPYRSSPYLWLGPNAAGHLKPPGLILSQGNNALWHYTTSMAREAEKRGVDSLGMYNATLQASSWDGTRYGNKVGLMQAMMIINWLARLDST